MSESSGVFISYRRDASAYMAQAIFQDLHANGVDVFYDIESIKAGHFDTILLSQIAARPYFLPILTPGTLDRCVNQGDWVRREIEHAMQLKRRIVPVHTPEFNFADIDKFLTAEVATELKRSNMLEVPHRYFKYAMQEVRTFLVPITIEVIPTTNEASKAVESAVQRAATVPAITEKQLTAQEYFEKGQRSSSLDEQIANYDKAVELDPLFANAYNNRGLSYIDKGEFDRALRDFNTALHLDRQFAWAYSNRGMAYFHKGEYDNAIENLTEAIRLDPTLAIAFTNRGSASNEKGEYDKAIQDYSEALRIDPTYSLAYGGRGVTYMTKGDLDKAIQDFNEAARLNPTYAPIYISRAYAYAAKNDAQNAIADGEKAISLAPDAPWASAMKADVDKWKGAKKLFGLF